MYGFISKNSRTIFQIWPDLGIDMLAGQQIRSSVAKNMKNEFLQVKELNTKGGSNKFKFSSFMDRIRSIDVDVIHHVGSMDAVVHLSADSSYFKMRLLEWRELNCTLDFVDFNKEISHLVDTFNLLIHNQRRVFEVLMKHLEKESSMAYEPILDLIVCFARDIRADCYKYFGPIAVNLCSLLKRCRDPKIIEAAFHCLGFVYKYLNKQLIINFNDTLTVLKPLLSSDNQYIGTFASVGLAFLLRKTEVAELPRIIGCLADMDLCESSAAIIFEACKGTRNTFHSKMIPILNAMLRNKHIQTKQQDTLAHTLISMTLHSDGETSQAFISPLWDFVKENPRCIGFIARMLALVCATSKGSKLPSDRESLHGSLLFMTENLSTLNTSEKLWVFLFFIQLFRHVKPQSYSAATKLFTLLNSKTEFGDKYNLWSLMIHASPEALLNSLMLEISKCLDSVNDERNAEAILALISLYYNKYPDSSVRLTCNEFFSKFLFDSMMRFEVDTSLAFLALRLCKYISISDIAMPRERITQLLNLIESSQESPKARLQLANLITASFHVSASTLSHMTSIAVQMLKTHPEEHQLASAMCRLEAGFLTEDMYPLLKSNIKSFKQEDRLASLRLLSKNDKTGEKIFRECLAIEELKNAPTAARQKLIMLRNLQKHYVIDAKPEERERNSEVFALFCCGILATNFEPLWKETSKILGEVSRNNQHLWQFILNELENASMINRIDDNSFSLFADNMEMDDADMFFCNDHGVMNIYKIKNSLQCHENVFVSVCRNVFHAASTRFDIENYHSLLMNVITEHLHDLAFKSFETVFLPKIMHLADAFADRSGESVSVVAFRRKLIELLNLFKKFNLSKKYSTDLEQLFLHLLSKNDNKIQKLAIECLISLCPQIRSASSKFSRLLDEKAFKDCLTELQDASSRDPDESPLVKVCIMRILFAKTMKSRDSNNSILQARRIAISAFLGSCNAEELEIYTSLFLMPFRRVLDEMRFSDAVSKWDPVETPKIYVGFLNNFGEILRQLGKSLGFLYDDLFRIIRRIISIVNSPEYTGQDTKLIKSLVTKRLVVMFENYDPSAPTFEHIGHMQDIFDNMLSERISAFHSENIQSVSSLMELFSLWSERDIFCPLLTDFNPLLIANVIKCINATGVKNDVVEKLLDFVDNLVGVVERNDELEGKMVTRIDILFEETEKFIASNPSDSRNLSRLISIFSRLLAHTSVEDSLIRILTMLSSLCANFKRKSDEYVLNSIVNLFYNAIDGLTLENSQSMTAMFLPIFSSSLQWISRRESRTDMASTFTKMAKFDPELTIVAQVIADMNSYSQSKIDEIDWDRQLNALEIFNEAESFSSNKQWLPIIGCLIYNITECEEISIVTHSTTSLKRYIETHAINDGYLTMHVIYPAIKNAIKSDKELVKGEMMRLLACCVQVLPTTAPFSELALISGDSGDTSFFENIYHIQLHRRARALRRLADILNSGGEISSATLNNLLLPVIMAFIFSSDRKQENQIVDDAIIALSSAASKLSWNHYLLLVRQLFKRIDQNQEKLDRRAPRSLVAVLEGFSWNLQSENSLVSGIETDPKIKLVSTEILPKLYANVKGDGTTEENNDVLKTRIPIAIAYASVLMKMNDLTIKTELPRLLTVLSQMLRSRSLDIRNAIRETMVKIADIIGDNYLIFLFKELSGALQRGYQLHILGFTIHFLLSKATMTAENETFDELLQHLVPVLLNDLFGSISAEKDVDELAKKMPEIRQKKSYASFSILSKMLPASSLMTLVIPIRNLMVEKNGPKFRQGLHEIFRNLCLGLAENEVIATEELIGFAAKLISKDDELFKFTCEISELNFGEENFTVQSMKRTEEQLAKRNHFHENMDALIEFGFSLLYSIMKNRKISYDIIDSLIDIVTTYIESKNGRTANLALKILAFAWKNKKPSENQLDDCMQLIFRLGGKLSNLKNEFAQNCLKVVTVGMVECKYVLSHKQVLFLLNMIKPDLEEPLVQNNAFSVVKALVTNGYKMDEIYAFMTDISKLMINSRSNSARELCRQAFLQFLLNYPMGKRKLQKHMLFLVTNLEFEHEYGRESLLEFLNMALAKLPEALFNEFGLLLYLGLLVRMKTDTSKECRQMIEELVKKLLHTVSVDICNQIVSATIGLLGKSVQIQREAGLIGVGIIVDAFESDQARLQSLNDTSGSTVFQCLCSYLESLKMDKNTVADEENGMDLDISTSQDASYLFQILVCIGKLSQLSSSYLQQLDWPFLIEHAFDYPHLLIRGEGCKLLNTLLDLQVRTGESMYEVTRDDVHRILAQLSLDVITSTYEPLLMKSLFSIVRAFKKSHETNDDDSDFSWFVSELSRYARKLKSDQHAARLLIFKVFALMAKHFDGETILEKLYAMLSAVHRYVIDETMKVGSEHEICRKFCVELCNKYQKVVGEHEYQKTLAQVEKNIIETRHKRREEKHSKAITDPVAYAKRKISHNESKKRARKRKTDDMMKNKIRYNIKRSKLGHAE